MKFNTIALILVLTGLAMLVAAGVGLPSRLYDMVHHTNRKGTPCAHAYETSKDDRGHKLICRHGKDSELVWQ
jgi:hypothetical protein